MKTEHPRPSLLFIIIFLQKLTKTIFIEILHVHKENPGWNQQFIILFEFFCPMIEAFATQNIQKKACQKI